MPTGTLLTIPGFTKEQYEKVNEAMDIRNRPPEGLIFHCAGQAPGGWRIFSIWESEHAYEQATNWNRRPPTW